MGAAERITNAKRLQLLKDAAAGAKLMDRFGRAILKGATFTYDPIHPIVLEVVDIKPIIDLRAEPGMHRLFLSATVELICRDRDPIQELALVNIPNFDEPPADPPADGQAEETPPVGIVLTDPADPMAPDLSTLDQSQQETPHDAEQPPPPQAPE